VILFQKYSSLLQSTINIDKAQGAGLDLHIVVFRPQRLLSALISNVSRDRIVYTRIEPL